MRHLGNIDIGVATHTGRVRRTNEDDFLLCAPQDAEQMQRMGWVVAIADGMGGAAGGAEASRTAVRAAVRPLLDVEPRNGTDGTEGNEMGSAAATASAERMRQGFAKAVEDVFELSTENPNLRGMGTTLTIVNLLGDRMVLGHVGDTRCVRFRDGVVEQLSVDHAVREPDNYLTRCIGAGQREVEADISEFDLRPGDRIVLMTDGLWAVASDEDVRERVENLDPQDAANELVRLANRNGGPDNSTVIIARVHGTDSADAPVVDVELPAEEVLQPSAFLPTHRSLIPSRWPWVLLVFGLLLLAIGIAKVTFQVDLLQWLVM